MTVAIPRQRQLMCGRAICPDRVPMRRLRATVAFIAILGLCWPVDAQAGPPLTIVNALPSSSVCAQGNTVSIFTPGQHVIQPGAQFAISDQCVLASQPAWYRKGVPTYLIATVTAEKTRDGCKITIARNNYTDAVTPGCCSPPGIGGNTCAGPWGITNAHVGEPWPPR